MNFNSARLTILFSIFFSWQIHSQSKKFIVVIDPGHGGCDAGAYGYDGDEKNVTLAVAKKLGTYIEKNYPSEVKIVYTRTTDVFVPLITRARIANDHHANLFISIHCNATPRASPEGTETYVLGINRSQDNFNVAKRENSVILLKPDYKKTYQGFDPNSRQSVIGLTLIQNTYLRNSIEFAKKVEEQFVSAGRYSRGVKQAGFLVIRETAMPAVLVETGFITNRNEGTYLGSSEGQDKIAHAIYKAFAGFKAEYDAKSAQVPAHIEPSTPSQTQELPSSDPIQTSPLELSLTSPPEHPYKNIVLYKVQLFTLSKKLPNHDPAFRGLIPISFYIEGGLYKYIYGNTDDINVIKRLLYQARAIGFSSAFIIGMKNGKRLPIQ
ncbi:MAG: N-acetylmuramoyl-L-alanine amidase [Flavobacteriales bacterium]